MKKVRSQLYLYPGMRLLCVGIWLCSSVSAMHLEVSSQKWYLAQLCDGIEVMVPDSFARQSLHIKEQIEACPEMLSLPVSGDIWEVVRDLFSIRTQDSGTSVMVAEQLGAFEGALILCVLHGLCALRAWEMLEVLHTYCLVCPKYVIGW